MDHPHIIHLEKVFETEKKIYLVLERCIGELGALLKERGTFKEADARKVLSELCEAVAYLHRYGCIPTLIYFFYYYKIFFCRYSA